jgi:ADP-heptose:LPS heptosyltransferase
MLKKLEKFLGLNPLDKLAKGWKKENKKKILLVWNRGLGDIPLWLYGMFKQIKVVFQEAEFFVLTRQDLEEGFSLLQDIKILVSSSIKRGASININQELVALGYSVSFFDVVLEKIKPKPWLKWQRGLLVPKLCFPDDAKDVAKKFGLTEKKYLGVHLCTETEGFYKDDKNWPLANFLQIFQKISRDQPVLVFGHKKHGELPPDILDLRGKTTLIEMLTIIKNYCRGLLAPDSGVLCMVYYLDCDFPLTIVSLWGNPNVGVLKQGVRSPNKYLKHKPLRGKHRDIKTLTVDKVLKTLESI